MLLSEANLLLHRVPDPKEPRQALTGIYVDPRRGFTAASDGKRLVKVTCPVAKNWSAPGVKLANGDAAPFVMPLAAAQEILKVLPKGKKDDDPSRYAALASSSPEGKRTVVTLDGKKAIPINFEPIEGDYPNFDDAGIFPKKNPLASVVVDGPLIADTIRAAALQQGQHKPVTLHVFQDRVVLQSENDQGIMSQAVQMSLKVAPVPYAFDPNQAKKVATPATQTSAAPKPVPPSRPAPAVEVEPVEDEAQDTARPRVGGSRRRWGRRAFRPGAQTNAGPTPAQRAFHTYLIRSRGGDIASDDLQEPSLQEKIEALKKQAAADESFATWPQWRKLFLLLVEAKAADDDVCDVLNGLSDIKHTSSVIAEWLKKDRTVSAEAA